MPTTTTTFSFNKPLVGGDDGQWGDYLNGNWDTVDGLLDGTTPIQPNLTEGSWQIGGTAITTTADELNELGDFAGVFTLPTADGTSGQAIVTDGSGTLSFADASAGGFEFTRTSPAGVTVYDDISLMTRLRGLILTADNIDQSSFDGKYFGVDSIFIGTQAGPLLGGAIPDTSTAVNSHNIGIGRQALQDAIGRTPNYIGSLGWDGNVAIGAFASSGLTTGSANTAIGMSAYGAATVTGDNNTCIGYNAGVDANFNFGIVGNQSASNRVVIGDNSVTNAYIKVSWTVTSDERDKTDFAPLPQGLDVVDAIETYTFKFDTRSAYYVYDEDRNVIDKPEPDGTHKSERTFVGFKAQQVEEVLNAAGFPSNIVVDNEDPENYKMKETALIPLLVNAIKELKQRVETLEAGA
jgi:hypothetical protein